MKLHFELLVCNYKHLGVFSTADDATLVLHWLIGVL